MAPTRLVYGFGDFRLEAGKRLLIGGAGKPVPLTPKTYETFAYLVEHTGRAISKDELMQATLARHRHRREQRDSEHLVGTPRSRDRDA